MHADNLFAGIRVNPDSESFEDLVRDESFRLERIVSSGQATARGDWYDQKRNEWVVLLKGSAALGIQGQMDPVILKPGDYLNLPAHLKHRVEWTDPNMETVWLALHY